MERGFWKTLGNSFEEFGDKFVPILKVFLFLFFIPMIILVLLFVILFGALSLSGFSVSNAVSLSGLTGMAISDLYSASFGIILLILILVVMILWVLQILATIAYVYISFADKNKANSFGVVFSEARRYFWRYLGYTILIGLIMLAPFVLLFAIGSLIGAPAIALIWVFFAIYFLFNWIFASYIIIREDVGVVESMRRSKIIVKGRWWKVFGYALLLGVLFTIASLIVGLIPLVGNIAYYLVFFPVMIIFFKNFYLDLRTKIKKG